MVTAAVWALALAIGLQRLLELRLARANAAWTLAQGGKEFGQDHYFLFYMLHGCWLAGWLTETLIRGPRLSAWWFIWIALFLLAQAVRYWCILSLGRFWNTRILVIPGAAAVRKGPYRYWRHPNYLAVVVELASVPLLFDAWITCVLTGILNAVLLVRVRIPAEKEALRLLK